MLNNVLKVPTLFTIDPSGHGNASGTLIINGDLMVYGNNTIIASSNVEISDVAISVATNLNNKNDLLGNSAGLDISNVASLKYNGTLWNFSGGQVSVENKRVALDVSFIEFRNIADLSLANINSYIDLSFGQLKNNIDNSYNAIYSRRQIDNSFLVITTFDLSKQSFSSSIDNSYVTKLAFDGSFGALKTYLDASYIIKSTSTNLNIIDSSLIILSRKLDFSYVSNSVFEGSFNKLKTQIDNSFASITITSLNTSSISVETINTKHHSQRFNNISWNQFGQDLSSGLSLTNNNNKTAISNDGKVVAYSLNDNLSIQELEQVVTTWTPRLTSPTSWWLTQFHWTSVCWSPYLRLFTSLSSGTDGATQYRSMWSTDAQFWNPSEGVDFNNTLFTSICWSQEKYMFVAVANSGDRRLAYSYNGKKWFQWYNQAIIPLPLNSWSSICWSKELGIFVAVADDGNTNRVATGGETGGATGIENWTSYVPVSENNRWTSVCWSAELRRFVAVAREGTNRVMTSITGYSWSLVLVSTPSTWSSVCWSKELELFVAVATSGSFNVMTSNNGTNWNATSSGIDSSWNSVCWSGELGVFVAVAGNGINRVMSSINGINWRAGTAAQANNWRSICWSPELGLFVAVSTNGSNRSMRTSLKSRPPTSYNVFNREFITNITFGFNTIDETGKWTFHNMAVRTLNVTGSFTNSSDDRLKHNEIIITNGLEIIEQLTPKFYQKTQVMLDSSYNGDLSGQAWTYEAGLIAQELLQIPDLSFAVSGGDYYQESYISSNQTNDTSANYDICYNLIKQPYSLNYNSVFVYGVAAIKELHAKVKAQETSILDEQLNNLITRIETMETALISPQ
jgi:hypothetical protein